jgi:ABC-type uncharacterized transport system ATPase subunit
MIDSSPRSPETVTTHPVLEVDSVTKRFAGLVAVDAVSMTIEEGDVMGLIGSNGAGKTTLLHLLYGEQQADSGHILFDGVDVTRWRADQKARRGMGLVFQMTNVFGNLSVQDNLRLGEMPKLALEADAQVDHLDTMLEMIDLVAQRYLPANELSHGQKQWLEIGMVLLTDPKMLLLDEPTSGMTRQESQRTASLLKDLRQSGAVRAMLIVEHNIEFMKLVSDRVTVMHRGGVLASGTLEEVEQSPAVRDSYLGRLA